jgi:hypothetical protein
MNEKYSATQGKGWVENNDLGDKFHEQGIDENPKKKFPKKLTVPM